MIGSKRVGSVSVNEKHFRQKNTVNDLYDATLC